MLIRLKMRLTFKAIVFTALWGLFLSPHCGAQEQVNVGIIPTPQEVVLEPGVCVVGEVDLSEFQFLDLGNGIVNKFKKVIKFIFTYKLYHTRYHLIKINEFLQKRMFYKLLYKYVLPGRIFLPNVPLTQTVPEQLYI